MYWNPSNSISTVKSGNTNVKFCVAVHRRNLTYPKPPVYKLLPNREPRVPKISWRQRKLYSELRRDVLRPPALMSFQAYCEQNHICK